MPILTARKGSYQGGVGYLEHLSLEGKKQEFDTLTCAHCSVVRIKNPDRTRPRARCLRCSRYICDPCGALYELTGECHNTLEMVDLAQAFPGQGPFLARATDKRPLYDTRLRDKRRLW